MQREHKIQSVKMTLTERWPREHWEDMERSRYGKSCALVVNPPALPNSVHSSLTSSVLVQVFTSTGVSYAENTFISLYSFVFL